MDSITDPNGAKRKRSPSDVLQSRPAPSTPSAAAPNAAGQINYLTRQNSEKLKLIEGDDDTFSEVLKLLDEYDGILQRRESLAGNLGANLVGPLLLHAFENYFQGPIYLIGTTKAAPASTVSWVDIVNFAREHPESFFLEDAMVDAETGDQAGPQAKVCRFWIKNNRVQISENDWRLIVSGVPARMLPEQLNPEDENAEMVTLDILESRFSVLIKKADAVATRTRQLNYQMKGRKNAIMARRSGGQLPMPDQQGGSSEWGSQSNNSPYVASAPSQQDLLRQFSLFQQESSTPSAAAKNSSSKAAAANPTFTSINQANQRSTSSPSARAKKDNKALLDDPPYRALMVAHIEKLNRGDAIWPPCDRCRRLKMQCIKNYTACLGCTKKHCKCFFREVGTDEVMIAGLEAESEGEAHSEVPEKKVEGNQKMNESPAMMNTNERPNESMSGFGQENRDVEMGGVPGAGISRPSSANNGSRSYYDTSAALFASLDRKHSPNGNTAPTGYSSTNPNTMTATMTVPASSSSVGNPGSNQGVFMGDSTYQVSAPAPQASTASPNVQDSYAQAQQHPLTPHQQNISREPQPSDVNYIRPIGSELRDVYAMPSDQSSEYRGTPNPQRGLQEDFYAEMQRHAQEAENTAAAGGGGGPDSGAQGTGS